MKKLLCKIRDNILDLPLRIGCFEKVSYIQFKKDMENYGYTYDDMVIIWNAIKLPKRATSGSAGYDFFAPFDIKLDPNSEGVVIPTGIRCRMLPGWVLNIYPRSGLGFKYGVSEYNTVGIIDSDYYFANNEGHIMVKLDCKKACEISDGTGFCQGIFMMHGITTDDNVRERRIGGLGSTTKK